MKNILILIKSFFSINQWKNNFVRHPVVSIFFLLLCTYTVFAVITLFAIPSIPIQDNYMPILMLSTIMLRSLTVILGLTIVYGVLSDNPFSKHYQLIIKLIGTLIVITPFVLLFLNIILGNSSPYIIITCLLNSINEMILGGVIIILAQVFSKGYLLKQENDLTI